MKPSQFSSELRRIAGALDKSKNPDPNLVVQSLRRLLSSLEQDSPAALSPEQVAEAVRSVASRLAASKNPDPELVVRDLKKIIAQL